MDEKMRELAKRVRNVIRDNRYLTMATSDGTSVWIAPLAYMVEPNYTFVYYSSKQALHSQHIAKNPVVACSIYNSSLSSDDVDGIQFAAKVSQVPNSELPTIVPRYFTQSFPLEMIRKRWLRPIDNFRGAKIQRFYRIEPLNMFTIDLESAVDKRVEVDLEVVREIHMEK